MKKKKKGESVNINYINAVIKKIGLILLYTFLFCLYY